MNKRKFLNFGGGRLSVEFGDGFNAYGIGLRFFGEDNTIMLAIHMHWALYLGISINEINKLVKNYDWGWRLGFDIAGKFLTINLLDSGDTSAVFWNWWKAITGPAQMSAETLAQGACTIIMPEKRYPASFEVKRHTKRFPRWLVAKQFDKITVTIENEGLPIPGKGENSHDCDDDAIFQVSSLTNWDNPNLSLKYALEDLAISVLKNRQQRASLDWLQKEKDPEEKHTISQNGSEEVQNFDKGGGFIDVSRKKLNNF